MDHTKKASNQGNSRRRTERSQFSLAFLKSRKKTTAPGSKPAAAHNPKDARTRRSPAATMPPVVARSYSADIPWRDTGAVKKNRKRLDVPLNVPGAEMRLPSLPRVRLGWRLFLVVLLAGIAAAIYFLWTSPLFRVGEAVIEGNLRVRSSDVSAALGIADRPVFSLNAKQLQDKLSQAFPEFSAAVVTISLPNKVVVSVLERTPVLTWYQQGGRTELVDENGYSFPMRLDNGGFVLPIVQAADLPPMPVALDFAAIDPLEDPRGELESNLVFDALASGQQAGTTAAGPANSLTGRQILTPELVSAILIIAQYAPEGTPLLYDAEHGLGWQDQRGWQIYLGDAEDMATKLNIYKTIVKKLEQEGIEPALISVEHTHSPYYRLGN